MGSGSLTCGGPVLTRPEGFPCGSVLPLGHPIDGRGGRTASQVLCAVTLEREDKITGPRAGRKGLW